MTHEQTFALNNNYTIRKDLCTLHISGKDCQTFLHRQFCNELRHLQPGQAQWNAWCNVKGRVIALFSLYLQSDSSYLLTLPQSLAESFVKRLKMYVMRDAVQIELWADDIIVFEASGLTAEQCAQIPYPHHRFTTGQSIVQFLISSADSNTANTITASRTPCEAKNLYLSHGLPWIDIHSTEAWLPQMLNMDKFQAVHFDKGCYPGQEIVIRTQHKGQVKRRLQSYAASAPISTRITAVQNNAGMNIGKVLAISEDGLFLQAIITTEALQTEAFTTQEEGIAAANTTTLIPLEYSY